MTSPGAWTVEVFFHEGRFHGEPEWPPSPARLFQALLAGAATGGPVLPETEACLRWLESLGPPIVGAPRARKGQQVKAWVPNNDLDAKGGDPAALGEIRTAKMIRPWLFEPTVPVLYVWPLDAAASESASWDELEQLVSRLYQLGRGVDLAWARATVVGTSELDERLSRYRGELHHPSPGTSWAVDHTLDCPFPGSLDSLHQRYEATLQRFARDERVKGNLLFRQPPKPRFASVPYDVRPHANLFELRSMDGRFASRPLTEAVHLVQTVRDDAARRLTQAMPERTADVERGLVGRTPDGEQRLDPQQRVRIVPLPSIGHRHVDRGIRRLVVEVPAGCPLGAGDVFWAFSGLELESGTVLTRSDDWAMLGHFGATEPARAWRSVTPLALPEPAARRRVDPDPASGDDKRAVERAEEESQAAVAVRQALRHAGVRNKVLDCRVQREPFEARGYRAEKFASGTRFGKERLWHVELRFDVPLRGPLVLGDGRFLGLGLMAPVATGHSEVIAYRVVSGWNGGDPLTVTSALRRAVMSRFQSEIGKTRLPSLVSGHRDDGSPAKGGRHLYFVMDPGSETLMIVPPHVRDRRAPTKVERKDLETLERAMAGFDHLNAGRAGRLTLVRASGGDFPVSSVWRSATPYLVDRHRKSGNPTAAVEWDVRAGCLASDLPISRVEVSNPRTLRGMGLMADVTLHLNRPAPGPVILGRSRFKGGGWFVPA